MSKSENDKERWRGLREGNRERHKFRECKKNQKRGEENHPSVEWEMMRMPKKKEIL